MFADTRLLEAARRILRHLGAGLNLPISVRLWDGSFVAMGEGAGEERYVAIERPGVMGALLRRPSLDTLFRQWTLGGIDLHGTDLIQAMALARSRRKTKGLSALRKGFPWPAALPLLLTRDRPVAVDQAVDGGEAHVQRRRRGDQALIQFHYDASNEFYGLFLDPEMVYSCAYFVDWSGSLEQAQLDKLEMICRKLRLRPGERFLDIGCGWGALVIHAARHHGVQAHGVTLSQAQHDFAQARIAALGLKDRVTVELRDYRTLDGTFDKIASIGMYEHVGIANYGAYFKRIHGLLSEGGIFLNHGITRRAKRDERKLRRASASRRVILKYIFPGSELDHIGHTLAVMETAGFEVHDVEGLRRHYARTCTLWHDRLVARRDEAVDHVGPERYRMWIAYLAGVAGGFADGPLRIFQTVATRQSDKAGEAMPPTRADLYRT